MATTTAGRAFARAEPIESDEPDPHRWIPLVDGTERLGVLRFAFAGPLTDENRRDADALAALAGELLVGKREHTDRYALRRRRRDLNLAAEMQWQQLPPLESSMPSAEVAGFVEPAYGVGGDGFDYSLNGDVLDLVIYDAVGHGLHAALLSTLTIAALRHGRRCRLGLAERLHAADEAIAADFGGDFVTAQVAQLSHVDRLPRRGPTPAIRHRSSCVTVVSSANWSANRARRSASTSCRRPRRSSRPCSCNHGTGCSSTRMDSSRADVEADRGSGSTVSPTCSGAPTPKGWDAPRPIRRLGHSVLEHAAFELHDDATMLLVEWRGLPQG